MTLPAPSPRRALVVILSTMLAIGAFSSPALAHGGTGGAASDYRIEITGFSGDASGISLRVIELGDRLELTRTDANSVLVLGYSGEPYLRLDTDGVFENQNSPARYLNLDRFASTTPPGRASAEAAPAWTMLDRGDTVRWHDHRSHWMSPIPPAPVQADPDEEQLVRTDRIDLVVDGRPVTAMVDITWLPKPNRTVWLTIAIALAAAVATTLVFVPAARRWATPMAIVALVASVLATRRIEVYEHSSLAGALTGTQQRVLVTVAIGLVLGVVAGAVVDAFSPPTARREAE